METMRKESRFWLSKVRGWAAGLLVASTPCFVNLSMASAGENYFIADEQPVAPVQASPSDMYAPAKGGVACQACESACEAACEDEPWRLFQRWNECREWKITGLMNAGGTFNNKDTASGFNGPLTFNDQHELQFNQLIITAENAIDTSEYCWDFGGRVDLLWGSDYIFNQTTGWETHDDGTPHWNGNPYYGLAMPQLYGEIGYNDLSVKVGRWYTPVGYEVVPSSGNFFYSHAYTHQYAEPFYHWGALATYKYSDTTTLLGGLINGWDAFDKNEDHVGGVAGLLWNGGEGLSFAMSGTISQDPNPNFAGGFDDFSQRDYFSVVVTNELTDCLTWVYVSDFGRQENANFYKPGGVGAGVPNDAEWYSVYNYLYYTINDCWKAGARIGWLRDDDGARVAAVRPGNPIGTGFAGNFWEMTYGLNWTPTTNITIRPELRYDWYDDGGFGGPLPFDDGNDDFQFTGAVDVVYLW